MNIPLNTLIKEMGEQHENVLLLAMSTLPRDPLFNTYKIDDDGGTLYFKSISQMETHTKYVLYKLAASRESLDRIVIMESEKARTSKPDNWHGETATSFYQKRIAAFLGGPPLEAFNIEDTLSDTPENTLSEADLAALYPGGHMPDVIPIALENPVYFWNVVNAIRGEKTVSSDLHKVHLYMDMQGGDRNTISQMNAIVELLERQGVTVKGRYANDYIPNHPTRIHTIREASEEYRTYDLISAMDAFARYGWGDSLEEYFLKQHRGSTKEKKLIKAIKQASSAISKCNADGFDSAVRKIENLSRDFGEPEKITQMDVVYQDIHEDYSALFNAEHRYVAQIRWCLKKKFLQQALTIFEARMPHEFIFSGLLYYLTKDADEHERQAFLETCENIYNVRYGPESKLTNRYSMKDLNHFLIKDYCNGYNSKKKNFYFKDPDHLLYFGLGEERKAEVISLLEEYRALCSLRNQMNHAVTGNHNPDGFFQYMKSSHPHDKNWKDQSGTDYEKEILAYLDKWERLANDEALTPLRGNILDLS